MEPRPKVTKEILCEEARFILVNIMAEGRYGRSALADEISKICEPAVSIPFSDYATFLEKSGYMRRDRSTGALAVTPDGETVVNGGGLAEFTEKAVDHFRRLRQARMSGVHANAATTIPPPPPIAPSASPEVAPSGAQTLVPSGPTDGNSGLFTSTNLLEKKTGKAVGSSGPSVTVGGVISDDETPLPPPRPESDTGQRFMRYEKLEAIGSGALGTVYRARQHALNRDVALKEVSDLFEYFTEEQRDEIVRRFGDVVQQMAGISHANIVPVIDVMLGDAPFVVTELAHGGSVRRIIERAQEIPCALAVGFLLEALHACRAAHQRGIVHRGLKPEQLLLDEYGHIKISDFGLTRVVERDNALIRQVYVGMGNVAYMAPELYGDPSNAGPACDIYALGIIFYEMLARRLPGRRSPMPTQVNPMLPVGIDDVFDRMTRDAQSERYATVDEVLLDLEKLAGLPELVSASRRVLVAPNWVADLEFKDGEAGMPASIPPPMESGSRPYSLQQRRKRP